MNPSKLIVSPNQTSQLMAKSENTPPDEEEQRKVPPPEDPVDEVSPDQRVREAREKAQKLRLEPQPPAPKSV
jgi:hypothetical protein